MSIASEISRLQGAKADIKTAIQGKGVTVPSAAKLDDYADYIDDIPQGPTPTGTKQISVTSNGTQTENVSGYASAQLNVAVPNSYSAGDEGKVVNNGALVAQTSDTVTENDTYDTTLINSLTVNVSGGGDAVMRQVTNIGDNSLKNAVLPEVANFSSLKSMGVHAFQSASGVKVMVFPKLETTANYPVTDTNDVETIDIGETYTQAYFAGNGGNGWFFSSNAKLSTLILRRSSVPGMQNINCFYETPFASGNSGGTLYVPQSLISSYQSATNWSTILGYPNNSIQAIEGSYYETHYADGTVIS